MKASVDDSCIACGLCVEVCPEVFELPEGADMAKVIVDEVPAAARPRAARPPMVVPSRQSTWKNSRRGRLAREWQQ